MKLNQLLGRDQPDYKKKSYYYTPKQLIQQHILVQIGMFQAVQEVH
jgi:hypothetical protein